MPSRSPSGSRTAVPATRASSWRRSSPSSALPTTPSSSRTASSKPSC
uniref:Uncharacterized protein n=1 Tax=Arundo donax TaxID=35708 RepID=A0A0A9FFP9_ARUDO